MRGLTSGGLGLGALGGMNFDISNCFRHLLIQLLKYLIVILIQSVHLMILIPCKVVVDLQINLAHHLLQSLLKPLHNSTESRKSYGTGIEKLSSSKQGVTIKKVFAKPKSRTKDLTNLVGYVKGQPYYGPFHVHVRDDGRTVKMVGIAHTTTPHDIIFDTVQESLE